LYKWTRAVAELARLRQLEDENKKTETAGG
jgi:hypothetical protein